MKKRSHLVYLLHILIRSERSGNLKCHFPPFVSPPVKLGESAREDRIRTIFKNAGKDEGIWKDSSFSGDLPDP